MKSTKIDRLALTCTASLMAITAIAAAQPAEDLSESLRRAETAFATSVLEKDWESFSEHIDADAIFIGGGVLDGKEAILQAWQVYFAPDGPRLEWHPEQAVIRAGGELGITSGPYTLQFKDQNGESQVQTGSFSSIWELQEDGRWRVLFDSGCPPCPVCGSS